LQEHLQLMLLDAPLGDLPLQSQIARLGRGQQGVVVQVTRLPGDQQGAYLGQREAKALGALDEADVSPLPGRRGGSRPRCGAGRQQPLGLIVAQGRRGAGRRDGRVGRW
jgi:hypothetical protein